MNLKDEFQIGEVVKIIQDDEQVFSGWYGYGYGVVLRPMTNGCYIALYKTIPEAIDSHSHNRNSIISIGKLESTGHFNNFTVLSSL